MPRKAKRLKLVRRVLHCKYYAIKKYLTHFIQLQLSPEIQDSIISIHDQL